MALSLPALAHRVTVFGSTRNIDATSAGVSSGSGSCVRDAIDSPPQLPRSEGRGPAGRTPSHGPASPRCPTLPERMKVTVWMDDESDIFSGFKVTKPD